MLAGDSPRFVTRNTEVMHALMQLHPLALAKAPAHSVPSQPAAESPFRHPGTPTSEASQGLALKRRPAVPESAAQGILEQQVLHPHA